MYYVSSTNSEKYTKLGKHLKLLGGYLKPWSISICTKFMGKCGKIYK